jgi:hypothetical protein
MPPSARAEDDDEMDAPDGALDCDAGGRAGACAAACVAVKRAVRRVHLVVVLCARGGRHKKAFAKGTRHKEMRRVNVNTTDATVVLQRVSRCVGAK